MIVDLADLQWWQAAIGIIGALGLSPAPWILGLAFNRIQFTKPAQANFDARVADLKETHKSATQDLRDHHAAQLATINAADADVREQRDEALGAATRTREAYSRLADEFKEVSAVVAEVASATLSAVSDTPQNGDRR